MRAVWLVLGAEARIVAEDLRKSGSSAALRSERGPVSLQEQAQRGCWTPCFANEDSFVNTTCAKLQAAASEAANQDAGATPVYSEAREHCFAHACQQMNSTWTHGDVGSCDGDKFKGQCAPGGSYWGCQDNNYAPSCSVLNPDNMMDSGHAACVGHFAELGLSFCHHQENDYSGNAVHPTWEKCYSCDAHLPQIVTDACPLDSENNPINTCASLGDMQPDGAGRGYNMKKSACEQCQRCS